MNTDRKIAIIAGVLLIAATAASLAGSALIGKMLGAPDYLDQVLANSGRITGGALLIFVAAAASCGIAISLYPVLRKHDEGLALGTVGFRLIEAVFYMIGALCLLSLLPIGRQFADAGSESATYLQSIGGMLLTMRDLAGFVFGVLAFCPGALMMYAVLYQSRLIPRWLSAWGGIAILMLFSAVLLNVFDGEPYAISGSLVLLAVPIAVQEIVMAVWLIVRGFATKAVTAGAEEPDMASIGRRASHTA